MNSNLKSKTNKTVLCCLWVSLLSLVGCSVKQERVANEPPVIKKGIKRFETPVGKFALEQASVFLWPENLTEEEAQSLVKIVNAASLEVDDKMTTLGKIQYEIGKAQAEWVAQDCVAKWSLEYDDIEESVVSWKTSENPDEQKLIQACSENQEKRKTLRDEIGPLAGRIGALSETIDRAIDPDAAKVENKKLIDPRGSFLTIKTKVSKDGKEKAGEVKVRLELVNFLAPGHTASTSNGAIKNANYSVQTRLLTFSVGEVDQAKQATGRTYHFMMERTEGVNGMDRFQGDVRVHEGEKLVRYGSARFDASVAK